jgi:hypothetical protein
LKNQKDSRGQRWLARLVWGTRIVDRLYGKFNGLRSRIVLGLGSDAFYDAFNDITYSGQPAYRPGSGAFQTDLFPWESRVIDAEFPAPPATVLVGGVGGGREALALERRGYRVVAFEPAARLATALHHSLDGKRTVEILVGRYQDLPVLRSPNGSAGVVDLRPRAPFDAAILGWASFSHIRSDAERVEALRQMAALTRGPVFFSYFSHLDDRASLSAPKGSFAMQVGFFRQLTEADVRRVVAEAGLDVVLLKHDDGWPCAVVRRR